MVGARLCLEWIHLQNNPYTHTVIKKMVGILKLNRKICGPSTFENTSEYYMTLYVEQGHVASYQGKMHYKHEITSSEQVMPCMTISGNNLYLQESTSSEKTFHQDAMLLQYH